MNYGTTFKKIAAVLIVVTVIAVLWWIFPPRFDIARYGHSATLLADGDVLVIGGGTRDSLPPFTWNWFWSGQYKIPLRARHTEKSVITSCRLYLTEGHGWRETKPLEQPLMYHTATQLLSGDVLLAGGCNSREPETLAGCLIYDPKKNIFRSTGSMTLSRIHPTATLLPNGHVLIVGGAYIKGYPETYDPSSGTWSQAGTFSNTLWAHTSTLLQNGDVLVTGGLSYDGSHDSWDSCYLYDFRQNTWETTGQLIEPRSQHFAALLADGQVLVAGGSHTTGRGVNELQTCELYNPTTGTWKQTGAMLSGHSLGTMTVLTNGQVLVTGGAFYYPPTSECELYDPASEKWSTTGNMKVGRMRHTATLLKNGEVLVVGGEDNDRTLTSSELYNPVTGTWSLCK